MKPKTVSDILCSIGLRISDEGKVKYSNPTGELPCRSPVGRFSEEAIVCLKTAYCGKPTKPKRRYMKKTTN